MNTRRRPPQMSLSFMLLMNIVFCVMAGAIYWASQVPAIRDEIAMAFSGRGAASGGDDRTVHMIFLLFTYTAPLLLAATLSTILGIWKRLQRKR